MITGTTRTTIDAHLPYPLPTAVVANIVLKILVTPLGIFSKADCLPSYPKPLIKVAENVVMTPLDSEERIVIKHKSKI
jgi:hypothetical protein